MGGGEMFRVGNFAFHFEKEIASVSDSSPDSVKTYRIDSVESKCLQEI